MSTGTATGIGTGAETAIVTMSGIGIAIGKRGGAEKGAEKGTGAEAGAEALIMPGPFLLSHTVALTLVLESSALQTGTPRRAMEGVEMGWTGAWIGCDLMSGTASV